MSALTSSIAHELGQPLSAMMHNAEALQTMVTAKRATPDTIEEILSDIQAEGVLATQIIERQRTMLRSHQLQKKPIDLHAVVNESLALVAHDMRARQIVATVNLSSNPCVISGDQVLLQQVLVNLVMNAMDAMAETPPARRRLTIRSEVRAADVEVSVRDTGPGLPADIISTLFTPFVTTKSHGLGIGLTIARTIIDAHGGTIDARNNPEGGATFTVTLHAAKSAASDDAAAALARDRAHFANAADGALVLPLIKLLIALCATGWAPMASAAERAPLVLETKIPLGDVKGRIDHLAIDVAHRRLFVAELGNDTVGVVDIDGRKVVRRLEGFDEPQGVAYFSQTDTLYVANGGDGVLSAFRGTQLEPVGKLDLGDDADNIRIDRDQRRVYVGTGSGNLTIIDAAAFKKIGEVELKAHPESFQLAGEGSRIYVNVPDAQEVAVVDRETSKQIASWPTAGLRSNYPMALDSSRNRVLVAFRQPATLVSFDAASGAVLERMDLCGDADDVFVDARRSYIYVACGQGVIDVLARHGDRTTRVARIDTSSGARTALFSPELDRLFLAARAAGSEGAVSGCFARSMACEGDRVVNTLAWFIPSCNRAHIQRLVQSPAQAVKSCSRRNHNASFTQTTGIR